MWRARSVDLYSGFGGREGEDGTRKQGREDGKGGEDAVRRKGRGGWDKGGEENRELYEFRGRWRKKGQL